MARPRNPRGRKNDPDQIIEQAARLVEEAGGIITGAAAGMLDAAGAILFGGKASSYQRRNLKARARGYKSYYEFRLHDNGKIPPGKKPPVLTPEERARRRGHRGKADFLRSLGEGDLIIMPLGLSSIEFDEDRRGGVGAFIEIVKTVVYARTGKERTFSLRNLTRDELIDTIKEEQRRGAIFSPSPSLDQRRLVSAQELKAAKR